MELSTLASAAVREVSAVTKLITDLIRLDHHIKREVDKRAIHQLCIDLRVMYFEPTGVIEQIRAFLANPPKDQDELRKSLGRLSWAYHEVSERVNDSIERVSALKAVDNLEIDLNLYELAWRVGLGKGRTRTEIGSVLKYVLRDFDEYWNNVDGVKTRLTAIVDAVDKLNAEIAVLEAKLNERT